MTIGLKANLDGISGAVQIDNVDVLSLTNSGNITTSGSVTSGSLSTGAITASGAITTGGNSVQKMLLGTAQNATSGTYIDFTGIPSWVKKITIMFNSVSTSGTSIPQLIIGTASGLDLVGYSSAASGGTTGVTTTTSTTSFVYAPAWSAASLLTGHTVLTLLSNNTWCMSHNGQSSGFAVASGMKTLGGTLDRIRITTVNGTDTFDGGSVNILLEGY